MNRDQARAERAWRLGLLLTGDREAAALVAARAMDAQPKEVAIPDARLDRLVLMRAREGVTRSKASVEPGVGPLAMALKRLRAGHRERRLGGRVVVGATAPEAAIPPALPNEAGEALAGARRALSQTELEAWVLREVEKRSEIEAAQAMNCSRSATERAYERANEKLEGALGMAAEQAARLIRRVLDESDADIVLRRHIEIRRKRLRSRLFRTLALLLALAAIAGGAWTLWRYGGIGDPGVGGAGAPEATEAESAP